MRGRIRLFDKKPSSDRFSSIGGIVVLEMSDYLQTDTHLNALIILNLFQEKYVIPTRMPENFNMSPYTIEESGEKTSDVSTEPSGQNASQGMYIHVFNCKIDISFVLLYNLNP